MEKQTLNVSFTQSEAKELLKDLQVTAHVAGEASVGDEEGEAVGAVDAFIGRLRRAIEGV